MRITTSKSSVGGERGDRVQRREGVTPLETPRRGTPVANQQVGRGATMLMFKRSQLAIGAALAMLAEIIVRVVAH
jgi:hypothetical protein